MTATSGGYGEPTSPDPPANDEHLVAREWYAAQRTFQRRPVRWALAGSQALRHGWRSGREMLGPASALLDLPGPLLPPRPRYPHLRVAHLGRAPLTDGVVPGARITPATWRTVLQRDRPDLLLVDDTAGWSTGELRELVSGASGAVLALPSTHGMLAETDVARGRVILVAHEAYEPYVDTRVCNPIGLPSILAPGPLVTTGAFDLPGALQRRGNTDVEAALKVRAAPVAVEPLQGATDALAHARRVLHLLAAGTPTVATDTPWLRRLLPPEVADVLLVADGSHPKLVERARHVADDDEREVLSVRGRRHVLAEHSRERAVDRLLEAAGIPTIRPALISVLLCTRRPDRVAEAVHAVARQTHPRLELQLVLHGIARPDDRALTVDRVPTTVLEVDADRPLGAALDAGLDGTRGDLVAKMDDDDLYGARHLEDLVVAMGYSGADVVGRWSHAVHLVDADRTTHPHLDRQEVWATHLPGATMLIRGATMRSLRWRHVPNAVDTELVRAVISAGGGVYSTHRFGFVRRRHGDHTFRGRDRSFRGAGEVTEGLDHRVLEV